MEGNQKGNSDGGQGSLTALHGLIFLLLTGIVLHSLGPGSRIWSTLFRHRPPPAGDCLYQVFRGSNCLGTVFAGRPLTLPLILQRLGLDEQCRSDAQSAPVPCCSVITLPRRHGGEIVFRNMGGALVLSAGRRVDINHATAEDLKSVPGIGDRVAAEIVRWRSLNGPFASVDELGRIPRIGARRISRIERFLTAGKVQEERSSSEHGGPYGAP